MLRFNFLFPVVYVFENHYKDGPIVDIRKSLHKICHYSNEHFSIDLPATISAHDFRRTLSTMAEETGMTKQEVATLLCHAKGDVTEGYITRSLLRKRNNLEQVEREILKGSRGWIMANWYGGDGSLIEDHGPEDPRPRLGFIEKLYKDVNEWGDHPQAPYRID